MSDDDFRVALATITYATEENDEGHEVDCIVARCRESGCTSGTIWGQSQASVRRALATLTEKCRCGADFHNAAGRR